MNLGAAELLGIVKYETPVPGSMPGMVVSGPQMGFDIGNIKWWADHFVPGEEVVVTEKLHKIFCCLDLDTSESI